MHTHIHNMAYVNIALSTEAYERLKSMKREGESFSQEILRITNKPKLWELAGTITEEQAKEWKDNINAIRKTTKVRQWQ